ncbi:hypothetical protein cand_036640 [Cryptosporidium andersoni]|uniref:C2H2-type domain-containing protein n=1 Tax=Cryptosporidium andersoni TaxID=117008 RepID=A0A1J4MV08_9CRYT|nr:hypothetical protein cand_036640 [Cryptosporidium andersoni]
MNISLTRVVLEELALFGNIGCTARCLLECVKTRICVINEYIPINQLEDALFQKCFINSIIRHPCIKIIRLSDGSSHEVENLDIKWENLDCFNLHLSENIQRYILNLHIYSNINDIDGRLAVYMVIAKRGFEGCWQSEISKILGMDPKMVFQHLKSLYRYDLIVRFTIPMPTSYKHRILNNSDCQSAISGGHVSAIIWLTRFFDFKKIPHELSQLIWYQHIQPLSAEIVRILEYKAPRKIAWERDIRTLCIGFLIVHEGSADRLICTQRTANKVFNKVRDSLLTKNVRRVFAWCPSTNSYAPCLCLKDAFPIFSKIDIPKSLVKSEYFSTDLLSETEYVEPLQHEETSSFLFQDKNLCNTHHNNEVDDDSDISFSHRLCELTDAEQVFFLIAASKSTGLVSLDISRLLGINMKRLGKLLADLNRSNYISKIPQRCNRTFMYRYYLNSLTLNSANEVIQSNDLEASKKDLNIDKYDILSDVTDDFINLDKKSQSNSLVGATEQFKKRLALAREWVEEFGYLTIPDFTRLYANAENSVKGPDRKTIRRILLKLLEIDENIKKTSITPSNSFNNTSECNIRFISANDISVFYWAKSYTSKEAEELKSQELKNKRSSSTRAAIQRRKKELSNVAAIVDASTSIGLNEVDDTTISTNQVIGRMHENHILENTDTTEEKSQELKLVSLSSNDIAVVNSGDFTVASLHISIEDQISKHDSTRMNNSSNKVLRIGGICHELPMQKLKYFNPAKNISLNFAEQKTGKPSLYNSSSIFEFQPFSQKILAHYGFVFSLMIRLKLLHYHLISIHFKENENNNLGLLSIKQILDGMNLDTFLRVVGYGYKSSYIEDYLLFGMNDPRNPHISSNLIKELPRAVYESLTGMSMESESDRRIHHKTSVSLKGRRAIMVLRRMLVTLEKLRLVGSKDKGSKYNTDATNVSNNGNYVSIKSTSIHDSFWQVNTIIRISDIKLLRSDSIFESQLRERYNSEYFDLMNLENFEKFWLSLQNFAMKIKKRYVDIKNLAMNATIPDIFIKKHWKSQALLPLNVRNSLEKFARHLMDFELTNSGCYEPIENNDQLVLSMASPEIQKLSSDLNISPLTTLRYLERVVDSLTTTTKTNGPIQVSRNRLLFRFLRDPKYKCHICSALYSTHPAILSHYSILHNISNMSNASMYMLRNVCQQSQAKVKTNNRTILSHKYTFSENNVPSTLEYLLEDQSLFGGHEILRRNDKLEILRTVLCLHKDEVLFMYCISSLSLKSLCVNKVSRESVYNLISQFILYLSVKSGFLNMNLTGLQFSRLVDLISRHKDNSKEEAIRAIMFAYICIGKIYSLNSKLLDLVHLRALQYTTLKEVGLALEMDIWKTNFVKTIDTDAIISFLDTKKKEISNTLLPSNTNETVIYGNLCYSKGKVLSSETFLQMNLIRSIIFSSIYHSDESCLDILENKIELPHEQAIELLCRDLIKSGIIKIANKGQDSKTEKCENTVENRRISISRNTLIKLFGKIGEWREMIEICRINLTQKQHDESILVKVNLSNINGILVAHHLSRFAEDDCNFDIVWNDADFYEKSVNFTDAKLFNLLNEILIDNTDDNNEDTSLQQHHKNSKYNELGKRYIEPDIFQEKFSKKQKVNNLLSESIAQDISQGVGIQQESTPEVVGVAIHYSNLKNVEVSTSKHNLNEYHSLIDISIPKLTFGNLHDSEPLVPLNMGFFFSVKSLLLGSEIGSFHFRKSPPKDPIFDILRKLKNMIIGNKESNNRIFDILCIILGIIHYSGPSGCSLLQIESSFNNLHFEFINDLALIGIHINCSDLSFPYSLGKCASTIYYLVFLLEMLNLCARIPNEDKWLYISKYYISKNKYTVELESLNQKQYTTKATEDQFIPINLVSRFWLLWDPSSIFKFFTKVELEEIFNLFRNSCNSYLSIDNSTDWLVPFMTAKVPINSFITINGNINLLLCGILSYRIYFMLYKMPNISIPDYLSSFSLFSKCELEFLLESLYAEGCIYRNSTFQNLYITKSISYIFEILEG